MIRVKHAIDLRRVFEGDPEHMVIVMSDFLYWKTKIEENPFDL